MESVGAQISNQTKDNLCNLIAMGTTADQNKRHTMHQWSSMMEMNLTEGCPSSVCVWRRRRMDEWIRSSQIDSLRTENSP